MSTIIEHAQALLDTASAGLESREFSPVEASDIIALAQDTLRHGAVQEAGALALEELKTLESLRRLLAYGRDTGRAGENELQLLDLLSARPQIKPKTGIRGALPAFEWLASTRPQISRLLQKINA
jgi:hypothetical protein